MKKITLLLLFIPFFTFAQGPWEFNTADDTEGWAASQGNGVPGTATATGTDLSYVTVAGSTAVSRNPKFTNASANMNGDNFNAIEIRVKNGTGATYIRINADGTIAGVAISDSDTGYNTYTISLNQPGTIVSIIMEFKTDNATLNGVNYVPGPSGGGLPLDIDYIRPVSTLSVDSFKNDFAFSAYPNPTKDVVFIKAEESIKQISVYSILGNLIKNVQVDASQYNLDMSTLSKGMYFIKLENNKGIASKKIIKN